VLGRSTTSVEHVNQNNWQNINEATVERFAAHYDAFLRSFDGFLVTHTPVFALLYEKFKKPIVIINSARYENPMGWVPDLVRWKWLNDGLKRLYAKGLLLVLSNNIADQHYLKLGTGLVSQHVPSLCLYISATYKPTRPQYVVYNSRGLIPPHPKLVDKHQLGRFSWTDLYSYQGLVHIPYEVSTMSIFEQYTANIPLFFPSLLFLQELLLGNKIDFTGPYSNFGPSPELSAVLKGNPKWIEFWIPFSDYYDTTNMPYITYFNSVDDLLKLLEETTLTDLQNINAKMAMFNQERKARARREWTETLQFLRRKTAFENVTSEQSCEVG